MPLQSSLNICLSSDDTLADKDQNDVIKDIMTRAFTSDVFAFTKNAVEIKIWGELWIFYFR